jgi:hypothetical protein
MANDFGSDTSEKVTRCALSSPGLYRTKSDMIAEWRTAASMREERCQNHFHRSGEIKWLGSLFSSERPPLFYLLP